MAHLATAVSALPYLDGLHRIIFLQFVDVVSYAAVESSRGDRVDDSCIMGLLLVPLAVGVDEQGKEAAKDGTAEPHGHHVEHVELCETGPMSYCA